MAVSLNNLPADEVIGWPDRNTSIRSTEDGTLVVEADRIAFENGGALNDASSGAESLSYATEGYYGLHENSTRNCTEFGYRAASAMDPWADDPLVYNLREYWEDGDTDWSAAAARLSADIAAGSQMDRPGVIVVPYDPNGYALSEPWEIPLLEDGRRAHLIGYGGLLKGDFDGPRLWVHGQDAADWRLGAIIQGVTVEGTVDPSNLPAAKEADLIRWDRANQLFSASHFDNENKGMDSFGWVSQTGIQLGLDHLTCWAYECQCFALDCGVKLANTFNSGVMDTIFTDCTQGVYFKRFLTNWGSEYHTNCRMEGCRVRGKSSPLVSVGFMILQGEVSGIRECCVEWDSNFLHGFALPTAWEHLTTGQFIEDCWVAGSGKYAAAVYTQNADASATCIVSRVQCKQHNGPFLAHYGASTRPMNIDADGIWGLDSWGFTTGVVPDWDVGTVYAKGDRVVGGVAANGLYNYVPRYTFVAATDPGAAGVNEPAPLWWYHTKYTGSDAYTVGSRVTWRDGKTYICGTEHTPKNEYIAAESATNISERLTGEFATNKPLYTFAAPHSYSVGMVINVSGTVYHNGVQSILEVPSSTTFVTSIKYNPSAGGGWVPGVSTDWDEAGTFPCGKWTDPLSDGHGYWTEEGAAVWLPECDDAPFSLWPATINTTPSLLLDISNNAPFASGLRVRRANVPKPVNDANRLAICARNGRWFWSEGTHSTGSHVIIGDENIA